MEIPQQKWEGIPFRLPVEEELIDRVAWFVRLRWFAALGVVASTWGIPFFIGLFLRRELFFIGLAISAYNLYFYLRLQKLRQDLSAGIERFSRFASIQFFIDWLFLTLLAHYSGGIESPVIFYFIFHAIMASILLPPGACYIHATLGVLLVGIMAFLELYRVIPHVSIPGFMTPHYHQPFFVAGILFFFGSAIYVSIYLGTSITRQLGARTRQLANLKQSLENAYHRTQSLYDIAQAITSTLKFSDVLNAISRLAAEAMQARACSIRLLDAEGRTLVIAGAHGLSEEYLAKGPVELEHSPMDRKALREAVAVGEIGQDSGFQYPEAAAREGLRSVLSVPLMVREEAIGILRVYTGEIHRFTEEETDFLTTLARQAAVAIENARTYQKLENLEQAKSDFVFTVAHELKAPIAAIQSILRVLLEGYAGEVFLKQKDLIARAERRLVVLLSLIRDLLALGALKGELPQAKRVDVILNGIINRTVEAVQPEADEKKVSLGLEMPEGLLTLQANEDDMERLLVNLLENAVKYTPAGGRVTLAVRSAANEIGITVSDTGIGIPPEALPRIFEEFYRAKNAKQMGPEGTGLGLSLVKHIVDRYHGTVHVESKVNEGTTFRVTLPKA